MKFTLSFMVIIPVTCLIALQDGKTLGNAESKSFGGMLTSHRTAEESLSPMSAADSQAMHAALHTELLQLHNELAEARAEAKSQEQLLRNVVAEVTDLVTERRHRDPFDSAPSADDLAAGTQALSHQRFDTRSSPDVAPVLTFERLANKAAHSKAHPSKVPSKATKALKAPTARALRSVGLDHDLLSAGTTAAPDDEAPAGTTAAPADDSVEEGATTTAPEEEGEDGATTAAPEEGEDGATTAVPVEEEDGATTAAPEEEGEDGATTAAPEEEEAEEGATTAAPDEETAEEGDDATESFARQALPFFGLVCAIVVHAIVL